MANWTHQRRGGCSGQTGDHRPIPETRRSAALQTPSFICVCCRSVLQLCKQQGQHTPLLLLLLQSQGVSVGDICQLYFGKLSTCGAVQVRTPTMYNMPGRSSKVPSVTDASVKLTSNTSRLTVTCTNSPSCVCKRIRHVQWTS